MKNPAVHRWFNPLIYGLLILLCFWPPYTQRPFDPRETQSVIMEILTNSTRPFAHLGWIFHLATLGLVVLTVFRPSIGARVTIAYFGLNYLIVAAVQTHAVTESYGLAIQTGALAANTILGILWLWQAWRNAVKFSPGTIPPWRWFLLPLALVTFWLPMAINNGQIVFLFDPLLFLTSPDYGLAYCFMTPVFLFFLILLYPHVNRTVFRITAFNAMLYGLLNMVHWFNPNQYVWGVMHLPLLILSLIGLLISQKVTQ